MRLAGGPRFDTPVIPGGYAWWYIDAISDDGQFGLTIIAFVGSVFSTYYALSGRGSPENHVAMNVALYGPGTNRWAMTERRADRLTRAQDRIQIGPSEMVWEGDTLTIRFDEICAPIPRRVKGVVRVHPQALAMHCFALDAVGHHRWTPVATHARIEVELDDPNLSWKGAGYFDSNAGDRPLEEGFTHWNWSRAHLARETVVLYEGARRDGSDFALALSFDEKGGAEAITPPPVVALPKTGWRVDRATRADPGTKVIIRKSWEDAPFYSRTALSTTLFGEQVSAVHESLSLDRLRSPVVRFMLPFRMPRVFW
ncbi:MAG: hydratase [Sphingomonadaceae bacterium]